MTEQTAWPPEPMDVATFLQWDDGTDTHYELIEGRPVAMNPPRRAHGQMVMNVGRELGNRLPTGCFPVAEAGIWPDGRDDMYFEADVAVTCRPAETDEHPVYDPVLIVEILSPSTTAHDRGLKSALYREIPSVRDILLVDSTRPRVEHWHREDGSWRVLDVIGRDSDVILGALGITLPLGEIYKGLTLQGEDDGA